METRGLFVDLGEELVVAEEGVFLVADFDGAAAELQYRQCMSFIYFFNLNIAPPLQPSKLFLQTLLQYSSNRSPP